MRDCQTSQLMIWRQETAKAVHLFFTQRTKNLEAATLLALFKYFLCCAEPINTFVKSRYSKSTWGTPPPPLSSFHPQLLLSGVLGGADRSILLILPENRSPARFDSLMEVRGRIKPGLTLMSARAAAIGKTGFSKIQISQNSLAGWAGSRKSKNRV